MTTKHCYDREVRQVTDSDGTVTLWDPDGTLLATITSTADGCHEVAAHPEYPQTIRTLLEQRDEAITSAEQAKRELDEAKQAVDAFVALVADRDRERDELRERAEQAERERDEARANAELLANVLPSLREIGVVTPERLRDAVKARSHLDAIACALHGWDSPDGHTYDAGELATQVGAISDRFGSEVDAANKALQERDALRAELDQLRSERDALKDAAHLYAESYAAAGRDLAAASAELEQLRKQIGGGS